MDDFVSRKSVLDIFHRIEIQIGRGTGRTLTFGKIIEKINEIPAADVRPVVHAEWEQVMGKYDELFRCSKCHFVPIEPHYFCSNCGADMRRKP